MTLEALANETLSPMTTRRVAVAWARHCAFLLGRTDAELATALPRFAPAAVRQAASGILRTLERPETRERLTYATVSQPTWGRGADVDVATATEGAFVGFIDPGGRV